MRSTATSPQSERPSRRRYPIVAALAGVVLSTVLATGCLGPVEKWVPDFDGNGHITADEVSRQTEVIAAKIRQAVEAQRRQVQVHPFLTCVRHHESDSGAYPHINGYGAANPGSTASGAYQFLDSTWRNVSARAGFPGYSRAMHAPWYVQDAVALWVVQHGGRSAWAGAGC